MKQQYKKPLETLLGAGSAILLFPSACLAASDTIDLAALIPVEMNMTSFVLIGALLLTTTVMFFLFQARFIRTNRELKDITAELSHTRENLTDACRSC